MRGEATYKNIMPKEYHGKNTVFANTFIEEAARHALDTYRVIVVMSRMSLAIKRSSELD